MSDRPAPLLDGPLHEDPPVPAPEASLDRRETLRAAWLAIAQLVANGLALIFTVMFARILGATDYGSLAALVSTFLILAVPGYALQVAVAREGTLGRLGKGGDLAGTLLRWTWRLAAVGVVVVGISVLIRHQLASVIGVGDLPWAAAATLPTGVAWLLLSVQRGALQSLQAYQPVGWSIILEALGRLVFGLALVAAGLGVSGAYLGTPVSMLFTALVLGHLIHRRLPARTPSDVRRRLRSLFRHAASPMGALIFIASLQNVDVIVAKHQFKGHVAGSYAAAAVAAKLVVWVAIGVGLYLLPEATRRAAEGTDPRPVLRRALVIVAAVAAPALLIFEFFPNLLLRIAFGPELTLADNALVLLGAAMAMLATTYLAVQYMLALGRVKFLYLLGVIAAVEPVVLLLAKPDLMGFATLVFAVQLSAAAAMVVFGFRARLPASEPPRSPAAAATS